MPTVLSLMYRSKKKEPSLDFSLYYRGDLKSNARPLDKHNIRRQFHVQLKDLWNHLPLGLFAERLLQPSKEGELGILRDRHGYTFAPLVCERLSLVAELNILLLWPAAPGAIITSGGDIDNRMKTLLDALKYPSEPTALPPGTSPAADEKPFYCLLEDDSLITKLSVETDRFLTPVTSSSEVVAIIRVRTKQLKVMIGTIGLA
jgi:hypothetical protein